MNIAVVALFMPSGVTGGSGSQAHLLSNELVRRGHRVTVFTVFPPLPDATYDTCLVPLSGLASRLQSALTGSLMLTFPSAVARMDFARFDIIHAHGDSHCIGGQTPVVRTFHSFGLDQMLHAVSWRRRAGMAAVYPLELAGGLRARARVFVSRALRHYYPLGGGPVIPNAVDQGVFSPGGKRSEAPSILFVAGTRHGHKRGELLLRHFQQTVRPRHPTAELRMVCAEPVEGPGVRWLGILRGHQLADAYREAWVFCLPSSHETFGVPYIEAMASGTPVVATPNMGAREVLDGGRFGILADPAGLGEALSNLLEDGDRRREMSERGRLRAADFSLGATVDSYERLFADVAVGRAA